LELFQNPSWLAVMVGQLGEPKRYDPMADQRPQVPYVRNLEGLKRVTAQAAEAMLGHGEFVKGLVNCEGRGTDGGI
ncbi:MAG: hypothetical protein ACPGJE_10755, partial [Wenzhouxiangellaceae bacterium]